MAQPCGVCAHPRREQIDASLKRPHNLSEMSRDLGMTRFAISRHRDNHIPAIFERSKAAKLAKFREQERAAFTPEREASARAAFSPEQPDHEPVRVSSNPQTAFLTSYAANGDLKEALKAGGITRPQLRKWQEHDEQFALRFHQAETEAVEALEAEARTRAVAGSKITRRVYRHGLLYEEIHEWRPSDAMLTKLLQAHKPERYGDKLTVTQTTVVKALDGAAWESV